MRFTLIACVFLLVGLNYFSATQSVGAAVGSADPSAIEEQLASLQATLDAERDQVEAEKAAYAAQLAELESLNADQLADIEAAAQARTSLSSELEQARAALEETQANLASLESQTSDVSQQKAELAAQIASQTSALEALDAELINAEAAIASLEANLAAEDAQFAAELQERKNVETLLRTKLNAIIQQAETADAQLAALRLEAENAPEPEDFSGEIAALESAVREKENALLASKTRIGTLLAVTDEQERALEAATAQVDGSQTEVASLQTEVLSLTAALSEQAAFIEKLRAAMPVAPVHTVASCSERTSTILEQNSIVFETGTNTISEASFGVLESLAAVAVDCMDSDLMVTIGGHTDSQGGEGSNLRLSENRADAVRSFFATRGVQTAGVQIVGYGEADPIATNDTSEGRALNRRITFEWQQR